MTQPLPPGWKSKKFSELNNFVSKSITPNKHSSEIFELYSVPAFPTDTPEYLQGKDIGSTKQAVSPDDVLVCKINPRINRVWVVGQKTKLKQIASSEWIVFRSSDILPDFAKYYFTSPLFREMLCEDVSGVGGSLTRARPQIVNRLPVAFPLTLYEQKRIVAKLDRLLAKVDSCRAHLDRAAKAIKRFRQSVLNAAVTGQLTSELNLTTKNDYEEISDYLSKQDNLRNKDDDKPILFEEFDLPNHWNSAPLGFLISACSYGSSQKSEKVGLVPVLRMGNIQSGLLDWEDLVYTSDQTEIGKYLLEPGDVLFNRTNSPELVGKTALYKEGSLKAIYAGYLIRVKTKPILKPQFLTYCLNSSYGRKFSWQVKTDGVSQSNINASKLCTFPTPVCSKKEQEEIVKRVEVLFNKADEMESKLTAARERVDKLTASILAKAFRGELVSQKN
ncbi:MAG: restriction endonuclease subunit S [Candidatus Riflebacteria bacterium]|nr:restriction endonuclease subunit S [Candidatus Riflebacteria bacterium]